MKPPTYRIPISLCCLLLFSIPASAQLPNPLELNTAANGTVNTFPIGALDVNWHAASGDALGPTSPFVPALVVGNCVPGFWYSSPFTNANWIAHDFGTGCNHQAQGCVDLYFRRNITLPATNDCGQPIGENFCLAMDFFADNSVYDIKVNGILNYSYTLPYDPYEYVGYQNITTVNLCNGWQAGTNALMVHIKSCPSSEGFLAQANFGIANEYYYPFSISKAICQGEQAFGYSSPGTYVDTIFTANGCDSIRTLELTVLPISTGSRTADICQEETPFEGHFATGTYIDTLLAANGCDSIRTLTLTVRPNAVTHDSASICPGTSYFFNGLAISSAGEYRDTLSTILGCDSVIIFDLHVFQDHFLGKDTTVCTATEYLLHGPSELTTWFDNTVSKTKKVSDTGLYWAAFTDENGCHIMDSVFVQFNTLPYLPNAFSPNNDGINDFFLPFLPEKNGDITSLDLRIFDRWGSMVYAGSHPFEKGWDGTHRGRDCNAGVYVYYLEIGTGHCPEAILKGDVVLVR